MHPPPKRSALDLLADVLTKQRVPVLATVFVATALLASQIPKIELDPAPENLIASFEGTERQTDERFKRNFGDSGRVLVLLFEGRNVLSVPALQYQHDVARHFQRHPWVERVDGLTVLPMPRRKAAAPEPEVVDLEALEAEDAGGGSADNFDPGVYQALLDLVDADPDRFPGGIDELGPRLQNELATDAVVQGDRVTAEDVQELTTGLETSPLLVGRLISRDHTTAAVAFTVKNIPAKQMPQMVRALRRYVAGHQAPNGVTVRIAGLPYLRATMVEQMRNDQMILVPITVVVCAFLLYLSMRWLPGVLLPIGAVGLCAIMVVGGMAAAGEPMNVLNNVIPPLLIIIGISEAIHLVERYREELARSGNQMEAGHTTVVTMAVACFLTTLTTAVGFAALVVSRTVMLRHFGITAALGVMLSYVMTMAFVPPILTWIKAPPPADEKKRGHWLDRIIVRITAWIIRRPWVALTATGLFLVVCLVLAQHVSRDHALLDQFDANDPVYVTTRVLEDKLDGVRPLEVMLTADDPAVFQDPAFIEDLRSVQRWSEHEPGILRTMTYADVLRQSLALLSGDGSVWQRPFANAREVDAVTRLLTQRTPNPMSTWRTADGKTVRFQIKLRDIGARGTMDFLSRLEAEMQRKVGRHQGVHVAFTGEAYNGSRGTDAVILDLAGSLSTAVVLIFIQVALLFRSARLGALCIPPNLVPLAGTLAYMVVRGIKLNAATVIIFSISIGLADYGTIHVLSRFQEETRRGLNGAAAIIRSARGTGRAVIVANLTLMAGFGVLLLSSFKPVQQFGELISVTVANCLIATVFMQPALLKVAGLSRKQKAAIRGSVRTPVAAPATDAGE
ncbi:MAG: efflux RND transporter permease subunit [Polyangiales bacterium]